VHLVLLILFVAFFNVSAQSVNTRMGGRAAAMGQAFFAASADASAMFQNAGALAFCESSSVFFAYELTPSLPGANRTAAAVTWQSQLGTFAAGTFRFGDDIYSEQILAGAYSNRIGDTSLGLKANVIQYRADGFGIRTAFTVDVGGLTRITPEWTVGAGIFNVNQASIAAGEDLPIILVGGLGWKAPDGPLLTAELEKRLESPLRIRGGMEVDLSRRALVRTGFNLHPLMITGGVGFKFPIGFMDFATAYHEIFGFTCQASASYIIGKPSGL